MKTPKVLSDVEREAARQLNVVVRAVKKQYQRLVAPSRKTRPHTAERQYLRAVEETIASAEKIIAKLKPRIAAAKRSLGATGKKAKKTVRRAPAGARKALKKRSATSHKKKQ